MAQHFIRSTDLPVVQGVAHAKAHPNVHPNVHAGVHTLSLPFALPLVSAVLVAAASCGPRTDMDPVAARAKFSSKSLSMTGAATSVAATNTTPGTLASATPASATPATATPAPFAVATAEQPRPAATPVEAPSTPTAVAPAAPATTPAVAASTPTSTPTSTSATESSAAPTDVTLQPPSHATEAEEASRILHAAATGKWPALRAHAIEASIRSPDTLRELAPTALYDENRGVRFVACMAIAEARLPDLERALLDRIASLLSDPSPSVQAAAMLALSRSGRPVNFTPLAAMLSGNDPEVRANAYLVLGEIGNPSAIPLIRESLGRGMRLVNPLRVRLVELAAAEALVKLGDQDEVEPLRAALFAPAEQGELTVVACDSVGRLRDEAARPMLERLLVAGGKSERSPEIRLAAARALSKLGASKAPLMVGREYAAHPDARVRAQAAALLGEIGSPEANVLLATLLRDQNPTVQIAAAGGIEAGD